jgi:hypothetical protein
MNALASYIQSAGLTGTAAEIVAALKADHTEIIENTTRWSVTALNAELIRRKLPLEIVAGWDTAVSSLPGGSMLVLMLSDKDGVNLADPSMQEQMKVVLSLIPADKPEATMFVNALLSIGRTEVITPLWEHAGLSEPTEDDVKFALQQVATDQFCAKIVNEIIQPLNAGGSATIDEIKAAIAEAV